jgi:hypothetical protein
MRPNRLSRTAACAALATGFALALTTAVGADEGRTPEAEIVVADPAGSEPSDALSGEAIYNQVLSNRFASFDQSLEMTSGDRGGNIEIVEMDVKYKSFREESKKILSKSIALYKAPQDVRHMGYLVVNKRKGVDDQFVYRPSARRTRRVNLRGESVVGTDFSLEDIIPRELEDAAYKRLPDGVLADRDVYVVEVTPTQDDDSEYSRFVAQVDKTSFVTLRNDYWDRKGVKFKELVAVTDSITKYDGQAKNGTDAVWVARESKVVNTRLESYTELNITRLVANPKLGSRDFSERKLAQGH